MVPAAHHSPEMGPGWFTNGTQVDVDDHKERQEKSYHYVYQVSKVQTAGAKNLFENKNFREYKGPSGDKYQRHKEIKYDEIGHLLERVEFSPAIDGIWSRFAAENTEKVIVSLLWHLLFQPAPSQPVIKPISCEQVPEEYQEVVDRQPAVDALFGAGEHRWSRGWEGGRGIDFYRAVEL